MPLKSKAQYEKFKVLEREGKLPKGTAEQWKNETPNFDSLPKRAKPTPRKGKR